MVFITVPEWLERMDFRAMIQSIANMLAELDGTLFVSLDNEESSVIVNLDIRTGIVALMYVKSVSELMYRLKLEYLENKDTIEDAHLWVYDFLIKKSNAQHLKSITEIL